MLTGLTLVFSNSMSNFAASDNSPFIVLVNFLGDNCRSSRVPRSLAIRTGLPPTVEPDLGCTLIFLGNALVLPRPIFLKVLSCLGLVVRLTTPPRPTFRSTFLLDEGKFLVWATPFGDFLGDVVAFFFFVVNRTWPLVVFVIVIAPPFVVFTSSWNKIVISLSRTRCLITNQSMVVANFSGSEKQVYRWAYLSFFEISDFN